MQAAEVSFARRNGVVVMRLMIGGALVLESSSQESIARELTTRAVRLLSLEKIFTTELPTTERALEIADDIAFSESLSALKLIAACTASEMLRY